jgi:uncharacterized membrane protein SpoIIM required for sporulation
MQAIHALITLRLNVERVFLIMAYASLAMHTITVYVMLYNACIITATTVHVVIILLTSLIRAVRRIVVRDTYHAYIISVPPHLVK